jgi:acetyl-CoA carboxylase carboxyl transferase subunit beta
VSWLRSFVRPKIRAIVGKKEVPDNLWHKCPECGQMIFYRELEENLHVCPHCDHHLRLHTTQRLDLLFDGDGYKKIELPKPVSDPLKFRDRRKYTDRLKEARNTTGDNDAIIVSHGKIGGVSVVAAILNFDFMGGSMGLAVGEGIFAAARLAVLQEAPLIMITASGGARMQEGILSLMQMPRSILAVNKVKEAGLPYITILTDPTSGGVSASFAMRGDIAMAEPGAVICFAGARVIEETIHEKLPEGFQRAEYLLEHGMVDIVVHRRDMRDTLVRILTLLCNPGPSADVVAIP